MDGLSVGQIVHYVSYGTPKGEYQPEHRAAIVTAVEDAQQGVVSLSVLNPTGLFFNQHIRRDESEKLGGTWHEIEKPAKPVTDGLTEGRMVHYVLTQDDAERIKRRRVSEYADCGADWPKGAQAHVGNSVMAGEHFAAVVVRFWPKEYGDQPGANLQVLLDGNDQYWVTSAKYAPPSALEDGTWHWIERA